jgi:hypothetical protein
MSGNTKTSADEPSVNYGVHADIQRTGFITASQLPPVNSDAHDVILSTFRAEADRAPNYDACHVGTGDLFEFPERPGDSR